MPLTDAELPQVMGKWFVAHSTLKLWKTGGRTNPSITYTELKPGAKSGEHTWKDVVDYVVVSGSGKAKPKSIVGTDVIAAKESGSGRFVWRGSGWLGWVTCPCEVLFGSDGYKEWAVVYFSKTLFTEDGIDIYSRECKDLPASTLQSISDRMKAEFPDKWALMEQRQLAPTRKDLSIAT